MEITDKIIERGYFWYYDQNNPWAPNPSLFPSDYDGGELLVVACTQLVAVKSYSEQKKLIKEWCKALPTFTNIKYLWFTTQTNQELFDAACEMKNLEGLNIKWSSIENVDKIINLANLKHLHLGSSSKLKSAQPIFSLHKLITLDLESIKCLLDLTPIANLTNLRGLGVCGDWNKTQIVESLNPLTQLNQLQFINLVGTKVLDNSLKPLGNIKNLESINTALWFKKTEFTQVYQSLPKLKYGNLLKAATDDNYCKEMRIK